MKEYTVSRCSFQPVYFYFRTNGAILHKEAVSDGYH